MEGLATKSSSPPSNTQRPVDARLLNTFVDSDILHPRYRGASLIKTSAPLGHYSSTMPRALRWSWGAGLFLMSEVPLYDHAPGRVWQDLLPHKGTSLIRNCPPP